MPPSEPKVDRIVSELKLKMISAAAGNLFLLFVLARFTFSFSEECSPEDIAFSDEDLARVDITANPFQGRCFICSLEFDSKMDVEVEWR